MLARCFYVLKGQTYVYKGVHRYDYHNQHDGNLFLAHDRENLTHV